jgi:hypothetical protein
VVVDLLRRRPPLGENPAVSLDGEKAYRELIVAQDVKNQGREPRLVEYDVIRKLLRTYGVPGDGFLTPEEFSAYRNRLRTTPVAVTPVAEGVSHVRVPLIEPGTVSQVSQALHQAPHQRGVVLDLRTSTGDDPQAVADVTRLFLTPSVDVLTQTVDGLGGVRPFKSALRPLALDVPLVVLIDGGTGGGAEALAAQLGRTGRAQVIGSPSRGADLRSAIYALPTGAALRLAVDRWRMGDGRSLTGGVQPTDPSAGDPLQAAVGALASRPPAPANPTVFPARQEIGKYKLGFNAGTGDLGIPGSVEYFPGGQSNTLRPRDELKLWYVPDYVVFNYKPASSILNFFADRIYTSALDATTDRGVRVGSTYNDLVAVYGGPGQNGYNEIFPFPEKARGNRPDRYYVNYDALGLSFGLETGTNLVREIGLFKPGS